MDKKDFTTDQEFWPPVTHGDILYYFVFSPSPICSLEEMKAYKSLESHNYFTSGWVKEIYAAKIDSKFVVRGRVSIHSMPIIHAFYHKQLI